MPTASPIPIISIAAPATTYHRVALAPVFKRLQIVAPCIVAQFRAFQRSGFLSGIYPAYFRNEEPIPSLWNCLNVSGIVGVIVQRLPQLANRHAEAAVKINERIVQARGGFEVPLELMTSPGFSRSATRSR